ncbi:glycosyltransferase family 1 protein [Calocera cornea HHB12733]|uniref:Glycosyltransferase family 1 protein n=1 Tax=Calocera cornea HHB12733 TaxID=1353952 RepID=A0A165CIL0_9BASI|nr:glycosyltransferase family 1 protein [Calocera cornea HHB12733]
MKVLISTMPATGHIYPFLPVATELVKRGHDVVWHTTEHFRPRIEATGAQFSAFDKTPDFGQIRVKRDEDTSGIAAGISTLRRLFIDRMAGQLADYRAILQWFPADVLFVDMCSLGALALQDFGGPVYATLGITPLVTLDPEIPRWGAGGPPATTWLGQTWNWLMHWLVRTFFLPRLTKLVNDDRVRLGLEPYGPEIEFFDMLRSRYVHIMPTTMALEYPRRAMPRQVHFVGPLIPAPPADFRCPDWWDDLERYKGKVVHVTQGTYAIDEASLIRPTISALASEDVLLVVTSPGADGAHANVPPNVRVAAFIPHPLLLPHVDCMITNAGYNGVLTALACGVPLVCAGRTEDKADVSARVEWSGAGIDLKTDKPREAQIRDAVWRVLKEPRFRESALRVKEDFGRHRSAEETCVLLESLARTKAPIFS